MIKGRFFILAIVITFLISGIAYCADGIVFPSTSLIEKSKAGKSIEYSKAANISKQAESFLNAQKNSEESIEPLATGKEAKQFSFLGVLLNMIKVLVAVVVLVFAIAGLIIAFRKFRSGMQLAQEPQSQVINEPANISEAVSSFVRHKLDQ